MWTLLQLSGAGLIVIGLALVSAPVALVVAGALMLGYGWLGDS